MVIITIRLNRATLESDPTRAVALYGKKRRVKNGLPLLHLPAMPIAYKLAGLGAAAPIIAVFAYRTPLAVLRMALSRCF